MELPSHRSRDWGIFELWLRGRAPPSLAAVEGSGMMGSRWVVGVGGDSTRGVARRGRSRL
jgi:hypothetical protein